MQFTIVCYNMRLEYQYNFDLKLKYKLVVLLLTFTNSIMGLLIQCPIESRT